MQKKTYNAPAVIRHGSAAVVTLGDGGRLLELINWRPR